MNWERVHIIDNVITTSYDSFDKSLNLGLLIYYDEYSTLNILSTNTLNCLCSEIESGSSYYNMADNIILFKFGSIIKKLNIKECKFETFCSTLEENIGVINLDYCLGSTSKRKPRISRFEIISTENNQVLYRWNDDKILVLWKSNLHLFQTRFKGDLYSLDINTEGILWKIILDEGIPGRRYLEFLSNDNLIVQKYFEVGNDNLLRLDLRTGDVLWELEKTLSHYNFEEPTNKLYGLGGKKFEVIDAETGTRELEKELNINAHISSHLTYYDNGSLYFSTHIDKNIPVFGSVNVQSGELEFIQEVEIPGEKSFRKGLDRPVVVGNRLYVKDTMNTLHIFERTKISL